MNPRAIARARRLAEGRPDRRIRVIRGDFYTIDLDERFDVVCTFDGFGIGADDDQRRLLRRIRGWLAPHGTALIEVYSPWYWAAVAGRTMQLEVAARRYDYDAISNRMLDTWWPTNDRSAVVTQSLRCYTPAELRQLLKPTRLELVDVLPGGAYDHDAGVYRKHVPLGEAMQYIAVLRHARGADVSA